MCLAIGIVLAKPERNNDQPRVLRRPRLNLSASSRPAPNPIAARVAAMIAISGIVTDFVFEEFISLSYEGVMCSNAFETTQQQDGQPVRVFPVLQTDVTPPARSSIPSCSSIAQMQFDSCR